MFPNVYGFQWSAGHLTFLGVFFAVVVAIGATVALAAARAWRHARENRIDKIRWLSDFHGLPARHRSCRHEFTGEFRHRTCDRAFDCGGCSTHKALVAQQPPGAAEDATPFGMSFPTDRLYHRGHTWVREEPDGTLTVGLDDFGRRLIGRPDELHLPRPGDTVQANGTGWTIRVRGIDVRVLAPVDGEVVETGNPGSDYYLKVRPRGDRADTRHLLRGSEIRPWLSHEMDRLQLALSSAATGPSLADGGVLLEDVPAGYPQANWDSVWGEIFLEP